MRKNWKFPPAVELGVFHRKLVLLRARWPQLPPPAAQTRASYWNKCGLSQDDYIHWRFYFIFLFFFRCESYLRMKHDEVAYNYTTHLTRISASKIYTILRSSGPMLLEWRDVPMMYLCDEDIWGGGSECVWEEVCYRDTAGYYNNCTVEMI